MRQFSSLPYFCVGEPFALCSPQHLPAITRVQHSGVLESQGRHRPVARCQLPPSECGGSVGLLQP